MAAVVRGRARGWRLATLTAGVVLSGFALHGRWPAWPSVWAALRHAAPAWLALAVLLQVASMGAASGQQRRLLTALRVPMPARTSLSITYVRAAMSIGLPAGSAFSTGYAFRQFRARGADNQVAVTALVLCGVASAVSLALLYAVELATWVVPARTGWLVLALGIPAAGAVAVVARRRRSSGTAVPRRRSPRLDRLRATVGNVLRLTRTITRRQWCLVGTFAALNWVADGASLLAAVRAVDLATPAAEVFTTYLVVQLVRQVPITTAGLTETSLVLALTAAGALEAPAAAAVLIYRLLSCWAVLPIGLVCWTAQQTGGAAVHAPDGHARNFATTAATSAGRSSRNR